MPATVHLLLLGVVALGLALRLWGMTDRLPDSSLRVDPIRDTAIEEIDRREIAFAWEMWRGGTRTFDPNPHGGEWPALSFYVTLLLQAAYRLWHSIASGIWSASAFAAHVQSDPRGIFLVGRLGGLLIGIVSIWLTYLLGARATNPQIGVLAAALVAANATHAIASQHVSDPNLLALVFVTLAALAMTHTGARVGPATHVMAGAMIGLAGASKYVPMALIPLLGLTVVGPHRESSGRPVRLAWDQLAIAAGAALVAFFAASPFTFLDWRQTMGDIGAQRERHLSEWLGQTRYAFALPDYLTRILPEILGWPAYGLALLGGVHVVRRCRQVIHIVLIPVVLLLANGFLSVAQPRFILPALSCLAILAAVAIVQSAATAGRWLRSDGRGATVAGLLGLIAVAGPLRDLAAVRADLGRPDSRRVARAWVDRNLDPAVPIATDLYGPVFGDEGSTRAVVTWPFFAEQAGLVGIAYRPQWLDGLRYCVISGGVAGRYELVQKAYPSEWSYFRWLRQNAPLVWESDAAATSGPSIEVRRLPPSISTRAVRDSLWRLASRDPRAQEQFALWSAAMAQAFLVAQDVERSQEWAERGLTIERSTARRSLYRVLAFAYLKGERLRDLLVLTETALREFPEDDALLLYRGMALDAAGEPAKAMAAYRESLRLNPRQAQADRIQLQILRLEQLLTGSQ